MSSSKSDSIWNDQKLVDALIDEARKGQSNSVIAQRLSARFRTTITNGAVAGKLSRLDKDGIDLPKRKSTFKPIPDTVRDAVHQDIKDGHGEAAIRKRNGVSKNYVYTQRKKLVDNGVIIDRRISTNKTARPPEIPHVEKDPPLEKLIPIPVPPAVMPPEPPPPVAASVIPFEAPAGRQPNLTRTCEFLSGQVKPWVRCSDPTAYGTPWCDHHGRIVFVLWPPKSIDADRYKDFQQNKDKQYG